MAVVYLARDLKHDLTVAVKALRADVAQTVGSERFLREIRLAAKLSHPHILPLFDSGDADGVLFYVMPYVEGQSLRDRLEQTRQLPIDEAVRIATEVAGALDYAHRQGIIHRGCTEQLEPIVLDPRITRTGISDREYDGSGR